MFEAIFRNADNRARFSAQRAQPTETNGYYRGLEIATRPNFGTLWNARAIEPVFGAGRGKCERRKVACLQSEANRVFGLDKMADRLDSGRASATVLILENGGLDPTVAIEPRRAQFEGFSLRLREPLSFFSQSHVLAFPAIRSSTDEEVSASRRKRADRK